MNILRLLHKLFGTGKIKTEQHPVLSLAQEKRALEKKLREQGYSRTHAAGIVAAKFKN